MNTLDTLYFPDTVLSPHRLFPLALVFNSIHLLQPVEDADPSSAADSYPFMETGFCQVHTPSRLGADRERFLHLVNDIQNRKDNYVEQLSYLSLASLSAPANRGDDTKETIISSLVQDMRQQDGRGDEEERLALWQARLVLKIAEILDREEEELVQQMAAIDDQEIALFRRLQGEIRESGEEEGSEDDPFQELLELRQKMNQPRPGMIKNRLRAWSRLYLSGPLPELVLWTTCRQEAADILLEQYEKECGQAPVSILQINLPAKFSDDNSDDTVKLIERIEQFKAAMQPRLQELTAAVNGLPAREISDLHPPASLLPQMESWQENWNSRLESSFPANRFGRAILTIHLLAGMPCAKLFAKTGGTDAPRQHGLLAVYG